MILDDLDKIIKAIRPKKVDEEKKFIAQTLKMNMKSLFALVKSHVTQGVSGIALVLYQELSGLAGSSMFRRVSKTLRESAGKPQGGRGAASANRAEGSSAIPVGFPPRRGRGSGAYRGGFVNQFNRQRAFGRGAGFNNRPRQQLAPQNMRCFRCLEVGHGYRECPANEAGGQQAQQ